MYSSFFSLRAVMMFRLDLGRGELPEAFEAEERSVPGLGDLLHLVSGRTLIGIVRERSTGCLDDSASSMHAYLRSEHEERRRSIPSPTPPLPGQHSSSSSSGSGGSGSSQDEPVERAACESMSSHASSNGCNVEEDGEGQSVGETRHPASRCYDAGTDFRWQHHEGTDLGAGQAPQILDLIVQEELVAVAVRQRGSLAGSTSSSEPRQQAGDVHMRDAQQHAPGRKQGAESRPGSITGRSSSDCIAGGTISMYTAEGQLLCTLADGQLRGGCLDDRVKFSVIRSATPLVRHLHFVAETGVSFLKSCSEFAQVFCVQVDAQTNKILSGCCSRPKYVLQEGRGRWCAAARGRGCLQRLLGCSLPGPPCMRLAATTLNGPDTTPSKFKIPCKP